MINKKKTFKYLLAILIFGFCATSIMLFFKISIWTPKRKTPAYRVWGDKTSPVKAEIFLDLECPASAWAYANLINIKQKYPGKIMIAFKHFPIPTYRWSFAAAVYAECAGKQNMFFEYVNELFLHRENWSNSSNGEAYFLSLAENILPDMDGFYKCLENPSISKKIQTDFEEGLKRKVTNTPTFFINGKKSNLEYLQQGLLER